jgi:hypothetical protein
MYATGSRDNAKYIFLQEKAMETPKQKRGNVELD